MDKAEFFTAAMNNDHKTIRKFIEEGFDINARDGDYELVTALHTASSMGHTDMVHLLLNHGANVNLGDCYGCTPLHRACECGHSDIVELLLKAGADPSIREIEDKDTAEQRAMRFSPSPAREEVLRLLKEHSQSAADTEGPEPGL